MIRQTPRLLTSLAGLAMLVSCVSVLPEPETAEALYRIAPSAERQLVNASVIVREPDAPRMFAGRAVASQATDGSLKLIPRIEWADTATRMLQIAMLDTLRPAPGNAAAAVLASGAGLNGDYLLSWRVVDFVVVDTNAHCQLDLTLMDGQSRGVISQTSVSTNAVAVSDGSRDRVIALGLAARACVNEAAAYVAAAAISRPAPE